MRRLIALLGVASCIGLAGGGTASGQTRGAITGTVSDTTAAVLPGASLTLSSPVLVGGDQAVASSADGSYRFSELLPGEYMVVAHIQGFQTIERREVRVDFGTTVTLDFILKVANVSETVTVLGTPTIDVKTAAAPNTLSTEQLQNLPLMADRRQSSDVIGLAPGTNYNSAYGAPRQSANALMIDGQTANLPEFAGVNSSFINNNWVEEVQIVGLGANAEYGEFSSIGANMVIRSGSNRFSGLAEYVIGRDGWVADNVQSLSSTLQMRFTPLHIITSLDSTAQVGGPLRKDKVFFFGGFQYYHRDQLPAGAIGNVPMDERWPRTVGKINWAPSANLKFEGFVEGDRDDIGGNGAGPTNAPQAVSTNQAPKVVWNGRVTWTVNNRTLVEVHNGGLAYEQRIFPTPPGTIDGPAPHRDSQTLINSVNVSGFTQRDEKRLLTAGSVTRYIDGFAGKSHQFKFGLEHERTENRLFTGIPGGMLFFDGPSPQVQLWAGDHTDGVGHRTTLYAQDSWALNGRVTIQPGVRFAFNRGWVPDRGTVFKTNPVSPRIGLAWDVTGDHMTLVRLSYGRFHDPNFTTFYQFMNTSTQTPRITAKVLGGGNFQELTRITPASNFGIDPTVTQSYTDHWVAGLDRELFADFSVRAQYIRLNFDNIMAFTDTGSHYSAATAPVPGSDGKPGSADSGGPITVYTLDNPGHAFLLLTNPAGAFRRYDAFQLIGNKRFSHNWQAQVSWTYSRTRGSVNNLVNENAATGTDTGMTGEFADPNKFINSTGPSTFDFTNLVNLNGTYRVPYFGGFNVSAVYKYITGGAWGRTAVITAASASPALKQGNETVRIEVRGTRRTDPVNAVDLRIEKTFPIRAARNRAGIYADIFNANNQGVVGLAQVTEISGANFGVPTTWAQPRTLQLGFKLTF